MQGLPQTVAWAIYRTANERVLNRHLWSLSSGGYKTNFKGAVHNFQY